ncbi:uncharacterized protein [Haliotis cracherodii]|uniref:uncharacterized protein n=1 Tax=Haliotis cracherodii TaxID=6455 RepID=UPI0039E82003
MMLRVGVWCWLWYTIVYVQGCPDCTWEVGEWDVCTAPCGGGYQKRDIALCCQPGEQREDCQRRCGPDRRPMEQQGCNMNCYNGGEFRTGQCKCQSGWHGKCCQLATDAGRYKCEEMPAVALTDYSNQYQRQLELLPGGFKGYRFFALVGRHDNPSCCLRMYIEGERGTVSRTCLYPDRPALWENGKTGDAISTHIGRIKLIWFEHDPDKGCAWRPDGVTVTNTLSSQSQYFTCTQSVQVFGPAIRRVRAALNRRLQVTVYTSNKNLAGTDSGLYLRVYGRTSSSNENKLSGSFEKNDVDTTYMNVGDMGRLYKIRIRSDSKGSFAGWHLNKVEIYEDSRTLVFHCGCWIGGSNTNERTVSVQNECSSIGYCLSQRCTTCAKCLPSDSRYFYELIATKKQCYRCQHIANCQAEECPCNDCQVCSRCEGVVIEGPGQRAYVISKDRKYCRKACSWRQDSTWCYPGTCGDELASNCICAAGFSGPNCQNIDTPPLIPWNRIVVHGQGNETAEGPVDPNNSEAQEDSWTNLKNIHNINYDFHTNFIPSGLLPTRHKFIDGYSVGIVQGKLALNLFKDIKEMTNFSTSINCENVSELAPHKGLFKCNGDVKIINVFKSSELTTGDVLQFQFEASNGGFVKVKDMENNTVQTHLYAGQTKTAAVRIGIDYINPYHCIATRECSADMLIAAKTSKQPSFNVSWNGWRDATSGIRQFELQVFEMEFIVSEDGIRMKTIEQIQTFNSSQNTGRIHLKEKGIFSIEITTIDKAGNFKSGRRIIIYDGESKVETTPNTVLRVTSAAEISSWDWQWTSDSVNIDWNHRYINTLHYQNRWLERVLPVSNVDEEYDDQGYSRGVDKIPSLQGIVAIKTAYKVDHKGGTLIETVPDDPDFSSLYLNQSHTISPTLVDGDTFRYWIRAYDVRGEYLEETVTVHIDTSPPIIENLWLTRGDRLNVSVHNIDEFNQMVIEWVSYDDHSGLETVTWRLFDNYTGEDLVHGVEHISAQGEAQDLVECETKYQTAARGPNCYCTPGVGCYHRHFQVKPKIVSANLTHGGIFHDKDKGVHDSDYYLEVTVMNRAKLRTTLDFKVTIDSSPPHPGSVEDGQRGHPEIDYQDSMQLHAHWEGFFDRESGVTFYQYGYAGHCLEIRNFGLDLPSPNVTKTSSTHVSWTAPSEGRFYITVVAFNRALEPSLPVCSDGVTVDETEPSLRQIAVLNSRTTEGLVTNGEEVWLVTADRRRSQIEEPDTHCRMRAAVTSNQSLSLLPLHKHLNGSTVIHQASSCSHHQPFRLRTINQFYMSQKHHLYVNWTSSDAESGIYDYELGLMSDPSREAAPDILPYTSTDHHPHYEGFHPHLSEGQQFYIAVKAINKAALSVTEVLGPITVYTQAPVFTPPITVGLQQNHLVTTWTSGSFQDAKQDYLTYTFAVGSSPGGSRILPFLPLQSVGGCSVSTPPSCTAVATNDLHWDLHHGHTYYVSVKVTNIVGLWTVGVSEPYVHDVRLPSLGVVLDICPQEEQELFDITDFVDSDLQLSTTTLHTKWSGFDDDLIGIKYSVCIGTMPGLQNVRAYEDCEKSMSHKFNNLILSLHTVYYVTVQARTSAGEISQSSDGVMVIKHNEDVGGRVTVRDGDRCPNGTHNRTTSKTNIRDVPCVPDLIYQVSTSVYTVNWEATGVNIPYTDVQIRLETKFHGSDDLWHTVDGFTSLGVTDYAVLSGLSLAPGHTYRAAVMFCAVRVCTRPVHSDGVTVIPHPPVAGGINITYTETELMSQLEVALDRFRDGDIPVTSNSYAVMDRFEWSLTDSGHFSNLLTHWTPVNNLINQDTQVLFTISLSRPLDFSKCRRLAVRGYNKVGHSTVVSADVRNCSAFDPLLVKPSLVIDAVGIMIGKDIGNNITLDQNALWPMLDVDYTPYKNVLSAVWPSLRHRKYKWAVVAGDKLDPTSHYKRESLMTFTDPCALADVVKCGETGKEFVNIHFDHKEELSHGQRFHICIQAEETEVTNEKWATVLKEVNACSDGITVDLTPPSPGSVSIQGLKENIYQMSTSEVSVNWSGFTDVEEGGTSSHASGIAFYHVALGSMPGEEDIRVFANVGHAHHTILSGLQLQDGHVIYATVRATDFVNSHTAISSAGFVIDSTPPYHTGINIQLEERYITAPILSVCWEGVFMDDESGIKQFDVYVGSRPGHQDISGLRRVENHCAELDISQTMKDGHSLFVTVKAYNRVSLTTFITSHALEVDTTAPSVGHVFDGRSLAGSAGVKDRDHITRTEDMGAHWDGFSDFHSAISHFLVKVGTCPGCEDTVAEFDAGARTDVVFHHIIFAEGVRYYVTVTACNKAGLCSSATSDGVILDQSPPVPGSVMDGTHDRDSQYQASRTFLGCKWYGFQDTESGLDFYEWQVGTTPGGNDILSSQHAALEEVAFHTLNESQLLPVGKRMYITVRAFNKAGMFTTSTSNGFIIDDSAPEVVKAPYIAGGQGSLVAMTLISRSTVRVSWELKDEESFIERQYISISTHQLGEFDSSLMEIPGLLREFTFTQLNLHDGSHYRVKVVACNMAGLCTQTQTGDILVDSSEPTTGVLAVQTDHAAKLSRNQSGWMTWTTNSLSLAWLGFADLHSGIDHYMTTVGSRPFANDLAQDQLVKVYHNISGVDLEDEGVVQTFNISTTDMSSTSSVFITMLAVNGVGLQSRPLHSELVLGGGGELELVRRCSSYSCEGHCVCAVQDKTCGTSQGCTVFANGNSSLTVIDIIDLKSAVLGDDVDFSPYDSFLAATWTVTNMQTAHPVRYEFSAGHSSLQYPAGIYEESKERVWFDAGRLMSTVIALPKGHELTSGVSYSVFVRAWYDEETYKIYKSDGILIDITRPRTASGQGVAVKELLESGDRKDTDYQSRVDRIYLSWNTVFMDTQTGLLKYGAYTSTSPGGYSIHESSGMTTTNCTLPGLSLESDTIYYSNILAYNKAGLVAWAFSDGVQIDVTPPVAGILEDGDGLGDIDYQPSQTRVTASWFGFADKDSTISKYVWCVGTTNDISGCDILDWQDVGLHTSAKTRLDSPLDNGIQIWTKVYAVDIVGHTSKVVVSDGVIIDSSPPVVQNFAYLGNNLLSNPSFEESISRESASSDCHPEPPSWETGRHSCIKLMTSGAPHAKHGKTLVSVRGSIQQNVRDLEVGGKYQVTIHVGYPLDITVNHKAVEGFISFGNDTFTFSLDPHLCVDTCHDTGGRIILWSQYSFTFLAQNTTTLLKIGTSSHKMEMALDHVLLQRVDYVGNADNMVTENNTLFQSVFRKHWSSVHASWHYDDRESPIVEYTMAAGTVPGGTQVLRYKSVGRHAHGTVSGLRLTHKQKLYLTITARNAAGLTTVSHPEPITVDMTPPMFFHVNDGDGMDIDYQAMGDVYVNWAVEEPESSILHCSWAIGTTPGEGDIKMFELAPPSQTTANFDISSVNISLPLKIFSTVRCINTVGLMSSLVSDGVTLTRGQLKSAAAVLLEDNVRYYYQRGQCLKNNRVRMHWAKNLLQTTVIEVTDESSTYQNRVDSSFEFATLCGLHFKNLAPYQVAVSQDSIIGIQGETTLLNLTTHGNPPTITGSAEIAVSLKGNQIFLNWDRLFVSPWENLQYELHIGTVVGGADILGEVHTRNSEIALTLISSHSQPESLFAAVAAIDPCGYSAHYQQEIVL